MCWEKIAAKSLRDKVELKIEESMLGGIYKWWAEREDLLLILKKLGVVERIDIESEIEHKKIADKEMYCIYVGQAEDLKVRLKKHIRGSVNNSTLRKSLGAILWTGENSEDLKKRINAFMDEMYIEYKLLEKEKLNIEESDEISKSLRILNIDGYNHKSFMLYIDKPLYELREKLKTLEK